MSKNKIIWLHPHFLNWMGGHKYIFEIASRLNKTYPITLVADNFSQEAFRRFRKENIKIVKTSGFSTNNILFWLFMPVFIVIDFVKVKQIYQKGDILVSSMFPMNIVAMLVTSKHVQLCYEPFALFYDYNFISGFPIQQRIFIRLVKFLYSWLDILATDRAHVVITLSKFNKGLIKHIYRRNSNVVYEGVDTEFFKFTVDRKIASRYSGKKLIFHSTDFTKIKGTEFLFHAMPLIKRLIPNVRLLISSTIQNSREKEALIEYAKTNGFLDSVEFLGFLPYKLLPAYMSVSNVVVQPSIGQSMNLTVKEAMSCATPVITSLEGAEQFKNGSAGFLVNPKNHRDLARKTAMLLNNGKMSKKMGKIGAKIIKEKFSWQAVYGRIRDEIVFVENEEK